jgi:hypothetical protein
MANKEEGACSICRDLRVAEVYQDRDTMGRDTDIIGLNIAMNERSTLAVEEMNSIANGKKPAHNACERDSLIATICRANDIGQVVALDIIKNNVVPASLTKRIVEGRDIGMVQLTKDVCLVSELFLPAWASHQIFFDGVLLVRC